MAATAKQRCGWRLEKELGRGSFGSVFLASNANNPAVALKIPIEEKQPQKKKGKESKRYKSFTNYQLTEAALGYLDHKNIVRAVDVGIDCEDENSILSAWPLADPTTVDLKIFLKQLTENKTLINVSLLLYLAQDLLCGIQYLHTNQIAHLDIKPENLLLFPSSKRRFILRIGDFGLAKLLTPDKIYNGRSWDGTPEYQSPEQLCKLTMRTEDKIAQSADNWAVAITLFELLFGRQFLIKDSYGVTRKDRGNNKRVEDTLNAMVLAFGPPQEGKVRDVYKNQLYSEIIVSSKKPTFNPRPTIPFHVNQLFSREEAKYFDILYDNSLFTKLTDAFTKALGWDFYNWSLEPLRGVIQQAIVSIDPYPSSENSCPLPLKNFGPKSTVPISSIWLNSLPYSSRTLQIIWMLWERYLQCINPSADFRSSIPNFVQLSALINLTLRYTREISISPTVDLNILQTEKDIARRVGFNFEGHPFTCITNISTTTDTTTLPSTLPINTLHINERKAIKIQRDNLRSGVKTRNQIKNNNNNNRRTSASSSSSSSEKASSSDEEKEKEEENKSRRGRPARRAAAIKANVNLKKK